KGLENLKKKSHKVAKGNQGKEKAKIGNALVHAPSFAPKPKNPATPKKDNPAKICHQCGEVERRNRTLLDMVCSMMSQTTLPKSSWGYALESATHILNMVPTKKGCEALGKRDTLTKPEKLEPRSFRCIFIGYPKETMGYSFYYPPENKVFVAPNAEFFKNNLKDQEASGSLEDLEIIQEEDTHHFIDTSLNHGEDDQEIDEPQSDIIPFCKSSKTRRAPDRMCLHVDEEHELGNIGEPAKYKAVLLYPESYKWLNVIPKILTEYPNTRIYQ
nr:hypothetical protein [Tanacetum cinerariifolium]